MTASDNNLRNQLEINLRKTERDMALEKVARLEEIVENIRKTIYDDHGTAEEKLARIKKRLAQP
jgi:uncharacterized membrane protein YjjP (DUF1212 family)